MAFNMSSIHVKQDSSYYQYFAYQDLNWQMTNFFFYYVVNFSYCQFKQFLLFVGPLYVLISCLYVITWQDDVSQKVHDLLPEEYKYFVVTNLNKTFSRVLGCATAAVVAKYHEELTVINLIISKWVNRNLHNQLISLYKT